MHIAICTMHFFATHLHYMADHTMCMSKDGTFHDKFSTELNHIYHMRDVS